MLTAPHRRIPSPAPSAGTQLPLSRARAEVELLATIAPSPRWLIPIAEEEGVEDDTFTQLDTESIWLALKVGRKFPDVRSRALLVRDALIAAGLYDDTDLRPFASGLRWGPGGIAALYYNVLPDPELVRHAARKLRGAN